MKDIQEVFNNLTELKKEQKEYSTAYQDALENTGDYKDIVEQLKTLREKKKQLEVQARGQIGKTYEKLEEIKSNIKAEKEALSDVSMTTLMEGKTVEVKDQYGNDYEPVWSVKFRKVQ